LKARGLKLDHQTRLKESYQGFEGWEINLIKF
jgi:hypothetical protein